MQLKARIIAFYLPQYHPIAENDEWWGKGFTEWTNVCKAIPLFDGHYQPRLPADLGFYDLRLAEVRYQQAKMAKEYGIEGFCYWHYWFGNGQKLLQRPFEEVLATGEPDFPFCLGWANESWTGIWHGNPGKILMQQLYPGRNDQIEHFNYLLPAFKDPRYITVEGKPLFYIYSPEKIPGLKEFTSFFKEMAIAAGLGGLYIVANSPDENWDPTDFNCDAVNLNKLGELHKYLPSQKYFFLRKFVNQLRKPKLSRLYQTFFKKPIHIYEYKEAINFFISDKKHTYDIYPCIIPNWDNTARSGLNALVLKNSTPEIFEKHVNHAFNVVKNNPDEKKIVFVKSWNEWAEGNYLEPDSKFGMKYLEVIKKCLIQN